MNARTRNVIIAALIAGPAGFFVATPPGGAVKSPPAEERPPWIDKNGVVDLSKAPEEVPVVGRDGKLIRDESGNLVMVPYVNAPPNLTPQEVETERRAAASESSSGKVVYTEGITLMEDLPEVQAEKASN